MVVNAATTAWAVRGAPTPTASDHGEVNPRYRDVLCQRLAAPPMDRPSPVLGLR